MEYGQVSMYIHTLLYVLALCSGDREEAGECGVWSAAKCGELGSATAGGVRWRSSTITFDAESGLTDAQLTTRPSRTGSITRYPTKATGIFKSLLTLRLAVPYLKSFCFPAPRELVYHQAPLCVPYVCTVYAYRSRSQSAVENRISETGYR